MSRYVAGTSTPVGRPRSVPASQGVMRTGRYTLNTVANLTALNRRQAQADLEAYAASQAGNTARFNAAIRLMKTAYQNERRPAKLQHYLQLMKKLVENKKAYRTGYRKLGTSPSFKLYNGVRTSKATSVSGNRVEVKVGARRGRFRPNAKQWWVLDEKARKR